MAMGLNPDVESALDVMRRLTAWIKEERQALIAAALEQEIAKPEFASTLSSQGDVFIQNLLQRYLGERAKLIEVRVSIGNPTIAEFPDIDMPVGNGIDPAALSQLSWALPLPDQSNLLQIKALVEEGEERASGVSQAWQSLQAYSHVRTRREKLISRMLQYFAILCIAALVLSVSLATRVSRELIQRLNLLVSGTSRVAAGELTLGEVPENSNDELGRLEQAFYQMTSTLRENQVQIRSLERMMAWQEVARKLAHEIKNPLTPILLIAQELRAKYAGDDPQFATLLESSLEIITEEIAGLERLVDDFSTVGKALEPKCSRMGLASMWSEMSKGLLAGYNDLEISRIHIPANIFVFVDRTLLKRALANLIDNAERVCTSDEKVEILVQIDEQRNVVIWRVRDHGPGIDPRIMPHIFEPYFTTREDGTGLGLAIVHKIMASHGGEIEVESQLGEGSTFSLVLPLELDEQ